MNGANIPAHDFGRGAAWLAWHMVVHLDNHYGNRPGGHEEAAATLTQTTDRSLLFAASRTNQTLQEKLQDAVMIRSAHTLATSIRDLFDKRHALERRSAIPAGDVAGCHASHTLMEQPEARILTELRLALRHHARPEFVS